MINGTDRLIYIKWDDEFLPIGCLISDSFNERVDMLDTTTRDNNGWKTSVPTNQSYNFSFDGLIINSNFNGGDFTKISYDRLRVLKRSRTLIEWKIQDADLTFVDSGYGYITELSDSSNIDEFISFSASIDGFGEPISVSEKVYKITDGQGNNITDGQGNNLETI